MSLALNIPDMEFYMNIKAKIGDSWSKLTAEDLSSLAFQGEGSANFFRQVMEFFDKGDCQTYTLKELFLEVIETGTVDLTSTSQGH